MAEPVREKAVAVVVKYLEDGVDEVRVEPISRRYQNRAGKLVLRNRLVCGRKGRKRRRSEKEVNEAIGEGGKGGERGERRWRKRSKRIVRRRKKRH